VAPRRSVSIVRPGRAAAVCTVTLGALAFGACSSGAGSSADPAGGGGTGASAAASGSGGTASITGGASGSGGSGGATGSGGTTLIVQGGTSGAGSAIGASGNATGAPPYLSPESGLTGPGVGSLVPSSSCNPGGLSTDVGPFCDQMVWNVRPARRVLYSWTTAEQVEELRRDRILLTRTETPGLGRGYAFTAIDELAGRGDAPENQLLAKLSSELFIKVRYAWPNAWATRMGWPGEDYGDQLLEIVLKPEAWLLVVSDGVGIAVIDLDNNLIPMADAIAQSERIGAVYFFKKDITGSGTFQSCSGGYREFIVGNEAMVEEWSLGTEEIRTRLEADARLVGDFLEAIRDEPPAVTPETFNEYAVCSWDNVAYDEVGGYVRSLSIPSEYYAPLPAQLAALGDTLAANLFEPDPLVVKPGG